MLRPIFVMVVLLGLLAGGYFLLSKNTPAAVTTTPESAVSEPETLEALLARAPASPIKTDSGEARFPWDELSGEQEFLQQTFTQPLVEMLGVSRELVKGLEQGDAAWCQAYVQAPFQKHDAGESWDEARVKAMVEDARGERSAPRSVEREKRYETWSMWFVALNERVQAEDNKRLKKAVKQFQKDFEKITDAYDEDLEAVLQSVDESFDVVYTKHGQSLQDPLIAWRALGLILTTSDGQTGCPSVAVLTVGERRRIQTDIGQWQKEVQADIQRLTAAETESVRQATQVATRYREVAIQHESAFDAAKSLFLRTIKE